MFTCFNVGAIAGAHAAKNSQWGVPGYPERYFPEIIPKIVGMVAVESSPYLNVEPSLSVDGVELRFYDIHEINKLIEKLTCLRDDMIKKGDQKNESYCR